MKRIEALVFLIALLASGAFFDRAVGTNALAHYDQAVSIAVFHELAIDRVLFRKDAKGETYAYTMDWSRRVERDPDGHERARFYPAKPPGLSLAAAPIEWVLATGERALGVDPLEPRAFRWNAQAIAWALESLPAAVAAVVLLRLALALGTPIPAAVAGTLALLAGTIWGPFASVLYAHAPTGVALALAGRAVLAGEPSRRRAAAAGAWAGLAVLLTYQAALVIPMLALVLWSRTRDARTLAAFAAGGLPALGVHLAYHAAAFGSPFRTAYDFQNAIYGGTGGGSYVTTLMEPRAALGRIASLTVLPYRGLFFDSPIALLALIAAIVALREKESSRESRLAAALALGTFGVFFAVNALHHGWWGGFTTGPRYLVPALPLLAPFAARAFARWPAVAWPVAALSLANALAIDAVSVSVHESVAVPLVDVYLGLAHGQLARDNLGTFMGLAGRLSLAPVALLALALALALAREVRRASRGTACPGAIC